MITTIIMKPACIGKKAYDLKSARTIANLSKKKFGRLFRIYRCPDNAHYHLTTKNDHGNKMR